MDAGKRILQSTEQSNSCIKGFAIKASVVELYDRIYLLYLELGLP